MFSNINECHTKPFPVLCGRAILIIFILQIGMNTAELLTLISDCEILICDFHREQDWNRFIAKGTNNIPKTEHNELKALLRRIARSRTAEELVKNREMLEANQIWQGDSKAHLRKYLVDTWFTEHTLKV